MRFRSLLSVYLIVPLAVTGAAVMAAMYFNADRHSTEMAHKLMASVTARAAQEVFAHSEHAVALAKDMQGMGREGLKLAESDALALQLADRLRDHPNITWISFSNPKGDFTGAYRTADGRLCINQSSIRDGKTALIEHVLDKNNGRMVLRAEPDTKYDPRTRDFYRRAVERRGLVWLPPYIFYEQGIPGISCAIPLYAGEELVGVFSVDYDLNYLSDLARRLKTSEQSQVMVFSSENVLLAHSALRVVQHRGQREYGTLMKPADVTDPITQSLVRQLGNFDLPRLGPGESQSLSFDVKGKTHVAYVMPMHLESGPTMFVATVAPKSDFAPSAWDSSKYAFLIVMVAFAGAGALAMILARRISAPITTLVQATEEVGAGNLNVKTTLGTIREFRKLSVAFNEMIANLRDSVRVRSSLALAREIQRRLLPLAPPRLPGFDIAGFVAYCDETGGDYYDYITMPAEPGSSGPRLMVVLGDMMGHGLPSALMMAGVRGALRSAVSHRRTPAGLLTHMNDLFYRDTDGKRFMTMCLLSFDLERGELLWSSAGHDPPMVFDPVVKGFHEPEGGDVPLGVLERVPYVDYRFDAISVGQVFFIGSDGVWETTSPEGEQFGKERLQHVLSLYADRGAEEIKSAVLQALELFRNGAEVRDDVTFIILKVLPRAAQTKRFFDDAASTEVRL